LGHTLLQLLDLDVLAYVLLLLPPILAYAFVKVYSSRECSDDGRYQSGEDECFLVDIVSNSYVAFLSVLTTTTHFEVFLLNHVRVVHIGGWMGRNGGH
jgi:hypothetical protein